MFLIKKPRTLSLPNISAFSAERSPDPLTDSAYIVLIINSAGRILRAQSADWIGPLINVILKVKGR